MIYRLVILFIVVGTLSLHAQKNKNTILSIGKNYFDKEEFFHTYNKNNTSLPSDADIKTPEEYMELFINFKLKVLAAKEMGLDTVSSFKKELKGYRDELAQTYLTNIEYDEKMLETAYYRTKHERKASHILIRTNPGQDTTAAFNRIHEIRKEIMNGADFGEMAFQYSQDPSARKNKGGLGYFGAFQMVYPFEDATYKTPVGELSQPIKTRFGYHLLKVEDERESKGQMSVAHIMKRFPDQHTHEHGDEEQENKTKLQVKAEIDSLHQLILGGADFATLAKEYSEDIQSAKNGGQLPLFTESRMVPSIAKAAFALKNDGDISEVVESPYGWHILKRIKHIPIPELDEIKDRLTENIRKNPQISRHSKEAFVNKLKQEYHFKMNDDGKSYLLNNISVDEKNRTLLVPDSVDLSKLLFAFDEVSFSIADFVSENKGVVPGKTMEQLLAGSIEKALTDFEDSKLEQKYPEFGRIIQEYHDGILLFNISEKLVWNKAVEDTTGLKTYYEAHKTDHMTGEQFKGWVITCKDFEMRSKVDELLGKEKMSKEEVLEVLNHEVPDAISIEEGTFENGQNAIVDFYIWNAVKPSNMDEVTTYVRGEKLPPVPKKLKDAKGLFISDYQKYLEDEWIKGMRKKYKIKVNKKLLNSIPSLK